VTNLSVNSTNAPLEFFDYLKRQNAALYMRVCDLIIFEEVFAILFGYKNFIWKVFGIERRKKAWTSFGGSFAASVPEHIGDSWQG